MPKVKLLPQRFFFKSKDGDFAILSCKLLDGDVESHPVYKSLTIKGNGIANFKLNSRVDCIIESLDEPGYPYSYKFIGFPEFTKKQGKYALSQKQELQELRRIMTERQAKSCNEAYPHFVSMVLNGEEDKLDYNNIKYVKTALLPKYIQKIKDDNNRIEYMPEAAKWGIEADGDLNKIVARYKSLDEFVADIEANPYKLMMGLLDWWYGRADKQIMRHSPDLACSLIRAEAACTYLLKRNEDTGNTRIDASALFNQFINLCPESASYIYEAVTTSPLLHYEPERKYVSLKSTYLAECHVADVLKKKIANPHYYPMDWQKFTTVDGLSLTDEQSKILELACKQDVAMLTGSAGCVDCDTEFFTGTGWKRIADYQDGDMVLQYNKDGTAELVNPIQYIKKPCDYLWHFETPHSINQTVCEDHRIIYTWQYYEGLHETNVLALKEKSDNNINWGGKFITQFYHFGSGMSLTNEQIRVMIAVMADGRYSTWKNPNSTSTHCRIRLKKERKILRLRKLLSEAKIEYSEMVDKFGVTIFRFYAPERRKVYGDEWWNVNKHQAKIIEEEVVHWDGEIIKSRVNKIEKPCFRTTEKHSADYIQYIFTINGWQSTIVDNSKSQSKKGQKPTYKVTTKLNKYSALCFDNRDIKKKTKFIKVPTEDGYKYCFTVPSHMLVLRRKDCIFITGNCGKTASIRAVVEMLDRNNYTYTLLGPTGISVKRLRQETNRQASTVHMSLLSEDNYGDYVIIDEASQISVDLLSSLFNKINDRTKLIFIADPSQLASISCGNVVRDMLDSGIVPVANLTKVFRYNTSGIITIATDVRNGDSSHLTDTFTDYKFVEIDTLPIKQIEQEYAALLADGYKQDEILILSPFNKGDCGSLVINNYIQSKFNPNPPTDVGWTINGVEVKFRIGDKVLNKKNEYHMPLWDSDDTAFVANGDMGRVVDVEPDEKEPYMVVRFDCGDCMVDKAHIGKMLLGYCISVHSSQGCQARAVIVVVDSSHSRMISRNLLYTAVSRAQERLVVIGDMGAIKAGLRVQEEKNRDTYLKELLGGR